MNVDELPNLFLASGFDLEEYYTKHSHGEDLKGWVYYCMHGHDKPNKEQKSAILAVISHEQLKETPELIAGVEDIICEVCNRKEHIKACDFSITSPYIIAAVGLNLERNIPKDMIMQGTSYVLDQLLIERVKEFEKKLKEDQK